MKTIDEKEVITRLQKLPESEVTKRIIIPLFENLGFKRVEYYHGTDENGKDIIFWERDQFGEIRLYAAQIKHFALSKTVSDSKSIHTIINQLISCFETKLPFPDDQTFYYPTEVFLITTFIIDVKVLLAKLKEHQSLKNQHIRIFDGSRLSELILKHKEILNAVLGFEHEVLTSQQTLLNNDILMNALKYQSIKDIKDIYTDIDFSIGRHTTQIFFNSLFNPQKISFDLKPNEWECLKSDCLKIISDFPIDFFDKSINQIEEEFEPKIKQYYEWKNELENMESEISRQRESLKTFERLEKESFNKFQNLNNRIAGRIKKAERKILQKHNFRSFTGYIPEKIQLEINKTKEGIQGLFKEEITKYRTDLNNYNKKTDETRKIINQIAEQINLHHKSKIEPSYNVVLDGHKLVKSIIEKRTWIENKVIEYNENKGAPFEIDTFLSNCNRIIDLAAILFSNKSLLKCINNGELNIIRKNFESTRLKMPINNVFETGMNICVLGEAGAGKTTCLQMYAKNKSENNSKLIMYLPLYNVLSNIVKRENLCENCEDINFEDAIVSYLNSRNIFISFEKMKYYFESKKIVLLLDGIDEAIKLYPNIVESIHKISNKYYNTLQVIITSRTSGSYLEKIPFFTITLLPFTNYQRNEFILKWFKDDDEKKSSILIKHLEKNKALGEVVNNPLLSTTICVLAQNQLPLPNNEINLYENRLWLYTGYYDSAKNINRLSTKPENLMYLAQKLAFQLHYEGKREEKESILLENAKLAMVSKLSVHSTIVAFKELFDPCNILTTMTEDGKWGFGHLRFQEHLAAKEIVSNRTIKISSFFNELWWRDTLLFFVRMCPSIDFIIEEVGSIWFDLKNRSLTERILESRPLPEQQRLREIIEHKRKLYLLKK